MSTLKLVLAGMLKAATPLDPTLTLFDEMLVETRVLEDVDVTTPTISQPEADPLVKLSSS